MTLVFSFLFFTKQTNTKLSFHTSKNSPMVSLFVEQDRSAIRPLEGTRKWGA
jgi:hypothetical protein